MSGYGAFLWIMLVEAGLPIDAYHLQRGRYRNLVARESLFCNGYLDVLESLGAG